MSADRRARFREYMRRLNPSGDPKLAVAEELYVRTPLGTSDRIVKRLEIEPQSSHLVIGGIGSGKTTELRIIERELIAGGETQVVFLDVPSHQDLSKLKPGVLLSLVGLSLGAVAIHNEALEVASGDEGAERGPAWKAVEALKKVAEAHYVERWDVERDDGEELVRVPGVLTAPVRDATFDAIEVAFLNVLSALERPVVALLDGLDRAPVSPALQQMIHRDVDALQAAGVGVVMVGPQALHSIGRFEQLKDRFTAFHLHGAVDVGDPAGGGFLDHVLSSRSPDGLLPAPSREAIIRWSGGTLRDLLSIARYAGEEAYAGGADAIQLEHIDAAADRFGRGLLLGAAQPVVDRLLSLKRVRSGSKERPHAEVHFAVATESDLELLAHRLLVEVPAPMVRYFLHPTIVPLLPGLRKSA